MTDKTNQYKLLTLALSLTLLITSVVNYSNAQMENLRTSIGQFDTGIDVHELMDMQSQPDIPAVPEETAVRDAVDANIKADGLERPLSNKLSAGNMALETYSDGTQIFKSKEFDEKEDAASAMRSLKTNLIDTGFTVTEANIEAYEWEYGVTYRFSIRFSGPVRAQFHSEAFFADENDANAALELITASLKRKGRKILASGVEYVGNAAAYDCYILYVRKIK